MQIIPRWHRDKIGDRRIMNVETCVDVGAAIIAEYLSLSGGKLQKKQLPGILEVLNKTYHAKIAQAYREMKAALSLIDLPQSVRIERIISTLSLQFTLKAWWADRPKLVYIDNSHGKSEIVLVALHP